MQINTTSDALDNLNKKLGGADIEIEPSTNKVDALKKIYKTLGGTDDVKGLSTVYQVLEKITEVAEGGGGSNIPTHNVKIEAYDTGADELVDYRFLYIAYFDTDRQSGGVYGFAYSFSGMAPEDHIYKALVIGDRILFEGERDFISVGDDDENVWLPDPDAELIRSVSGSATKDADNQVTITGDCTITINVIQD